MSNNKAVIDIENGGFSRSAGIVEIGMIIIDENNKEIARFGAIISRYFVEGTEELCKYSDEAIEIHGVTAEVQEAEGINPREAVIQMEALIQDYDVIEFMGHSIKKFDCPILVKFFDEFSKYDCEDWFPIQTCIHEIAKKEFELDSYSMESLCEEFNVVNINPHRALGDCDASLKLLIAMNNVE